MASENTDAGSDDPLILDRTHADECHDRWIKRKNRIWPSEEDDIPDVYINEQCGQCRFYILLEGALGTDWGACSNPVSEFDGRVMFEHDGCDAYSGANEWVSSYLYLLAEQESKKA